MNNEPIDEPFRIRALEDALSDRWKSLTDEQHKYLEYAISNYPDIIKEAKQRADEEGYELPKAWNVLNYYVDRPYTYIHFTNNPKLIGINPKTQYGTPAGIYGYPLTKNILSKITSEWFAAERSYIVIFAAANPETMLNLSTYTELNFKNDVEKLYKDPNGFAISKFNPASKFNPDKNTKKKSEETDLDDFDFCSDVNRAEDFEYINKVINDVMFMAGQEAYQLMLHL